MCRPKHGQARQLMSSFGEKSLGKALQLQASYVAEQEKLGVHLHPSSSPERVDKKEEGLFEGTGENPSKDRQSHWIREFSGETQQHFMSSRSNKKLRHVSVQVVRPKLAVPWCMLRCCIVAGLLHKTPLDFLTCSRSRHCISFSLWFG